MKNSFDFMTGAGNMNFEMPELLLACMARSMESTSAIMFLKDADLKYVAVSKPMVDLARKASAAELIGRTPLEVFEDPDMARRYVEDDMKVLNSGQVIKTGYNDYLGNYVVVSHGCGLATWYAHLSHIDVTQGSYVLKGETIGNIGRSGLSNSENVVVFVSLAGVFINPMYVCGNKFDGN